MVVDLMDDLANKDEIVARIREINGQIGAEDDMSPEEKQKAANSKKQKEQQVQKQQQITEIMQQLEVAFKQAEVNEKQAKSMNEMMDGMLKKLQTFVEAMGAAGTLAANPHLAKAADNLLQEADAVVGSGKGKEMTAQQQNQ
jgi:predicted RNA-binding protein Jag